MKLAPKLMLTISLRVLLEDGISQDYAAVNFIHTSTVPPTMSTIVASSSSRGSIFIMRMQPVGHWKIQQ